MFSLPASLALTVTFALTSGYALVRWVALRAGAGRPGDPVAELSHLVMGLAMLGMVWGYGGGPVAAWAQLGLFAGLAGHFLARWAAARRGHGPGHCPAPLFHVLMNLAMVWMVVAMPLLMGGGHGQMAGQMDGMDMSAPTLRGPADLLPAGLAALAGPLTVLTAAALVIAAGFWTRRLVAGEAPAALRSPAGGPAGAPAVRGSGAVVTEPRAATVTWTSTRTDAACHLVMALGMAASLLLMR